ncbi:hypothetical protein EX30DRAFT_342677 [Ascodesmis nigricans]|uniref:Uncharacterized protein n=1 Tax=Ascodesmis nigricans TaxID=341454 RepID=A0A4S2MPA4_9PEZI|nr:hypothetical protein EX30DRAFT_342677 [Ascodesmis nigricans]
MWLYWLYCRCSGTLGTTICTPGCLGTVKALTQQRSARSSGFRRCACRAWADAEDRHRLAHQPIRVNVGDDTDSDSDSCSES